MYSVKTGMQVRTYCFKRPSAKEKPGNGNSSREHSHLTLHQEISKKFFSFCIQAALLQCIQKKIDVFLPMLRR